MWYLFCAGIAVIIILVSIVQFIKARGANSNYTEFELTQENFYNFFGVDKHE